jgi:tetratricopeptide (TPR) repeat protein
MYIKTKQILASYLSSLNFFSSLSQKRVRFGVILGIGGISALLFFVFYSFHKQSEASHREFILQKALEQCNRSDRKSQEALQNLLRPYLSQSKSFQKLYDLTCLRLGQWSDLEKQLQKNSDRSLYEHYLLATLQMEMLYPTSSIEKVFQELIEQDPSSPYAVLAQIRLSLLRKDFPAIESLLQRPEIQEEPEYFLLKGRFLHQSEAFLQGLQKDPNSLSLQLHYAYTLLEQNQLSFASFFLAEPERFIEIPFAQVVLGLYAEKQGRKEDAEKAYQQALGYGFDESSLRLGNFYLQNHQWTQALDYLQPALDKNPSFSLWRTRGQVYRQLQRFTEALQDFEKALLASPSPVDPELLMEIAQSALALKQYEKAQKTLEHLLQIKPLHTPALKGLTLALLKQEQWQNALNSLQSWISLDPEAYFIRAEIYFRQKNYRQCISDCTKLFTLGQKEGKIFFLRGQSYFFLEAYPEALEDFQQARNLDPHEYRTLFYLARLYQLQRKYSEAFVLMEELLRAAPENPEYVFYRGELFAYQLDHEKAILDFNYFIETRPEDPRGYFRRATSHLALQNYTLAQKDFDYLIQKYPHLPDYWFYRGKLYVAREQNEKAHSDFQQCLQLQGNHLEALSSQGLLYFQEKKFDKAQLLFARSQEFDPKSPLFPTYIERSRRFSKALRYLEIGSQTAEEAYEIGIYYLHLEQEEEAISAFKKATELDPSFFKGYLEIARLFAQKKQEQKALQTLKKAVERGYRNSEELQNDLAFALLKEQSLYQELLKEMKKEKNLNTSPQSEPVEQETPTTSISSKESQ